MSLARGLRPAVIRLYDAAESVHLLERAGLAPGPCLLVLGFDGPAELVAAEERLTLAECLRRGGQDLGRPLAEAWERSRFDASWLERGNGPGRVADAIEVSAPWDRLLQVYTAMRAALLPLTDTLWGHFSHMYTQGASLYLICFASGADDAAARQRYLEIWAAAMAACLAAGGSISHHHGVGAVRAPWLAQDLGPGPAALLRRVKAALDPAGILNPGKLLSEV